MSTNNSTTRFSNRVEDYVKYRPGYPLEILNFLQQQYALTPGKTIADVGAGTGIFTALLLRAGYEVYAVEPNQAMLNKAIELLGSSDRFIPVHAAAEATGLADKSVDAVVAGQAFHWFNAEQAKQEFRRILKPNGIVVLLWNERRTVSAFEVAYDELIVKHARDYLKVDHRNIDFDSVADFFSPGLVELEVFDNEQVFDLEGLRGRLLSSSYMPAVDEEGYDAMTADLKILFEEFQEEGVIVISYNTKVYTGHLV